MKQMYTPVKAIRDFFDTPGRPVTLEEMKALTKEDRAELGELCMNAINAELDAQLEAENPISTEE